MTREQIIRLIEIGRIYGRDDAISTLDMLLDDERMANADAARDVDLDPTGQDEDLQPVRQGCSEYDTMDSRGEPLRPRVNEAGEPYWM